MKCFLVRVCRHHSQRLTVAGLGEVSLTAVSNEKGGMELKWGEMTWISPVISGDRVKFVENATGDGIPYL